MTRVIFSLAPFILVASISAAPARPASGPSPVQSFENIKVLTDLSDTEVRREMQAWASALGVQCNHCHVMGNFASDENPKKEIARKMATMVRSINKDFLEGKANCNLCHRGSAVPEAAQ